MSPVAIPWAASITAFSPEPHTLLIVSAATVDRQPAVERRLPRRILAVPGLDDVAHDALVDAAPDRCRRGATASRTTSAPSCGAVKSFSAPRNLPVGVRTAETMTEFFMRSSLEARGAHSA